jgi:hypothetical protein
VNDAPCCDGLRYSRYSILSENPRCYGVFGYVANENRCCVIRFSCVIRNPDTE